MGEVGFLKARVVDIKNVLNLYCAVLLAKQFRVKFVRIGSNVLTAQVGVFVHTYKYI